MQDTDSYPQKENSSLAAFLRKKDSGHPAYVKIRSVQTPHGQIGETAFPRSKDSSSTDLHLRADILIPRNLWLVVQAELSLYRRHVLPVIRIW